jgi:hypothetical protein
MKKVVFSYGIISAVFAVFHLGFWWLFDWPASLQYMAMGHRMLMQTFNFCMIPLFFFLTYVYLARRDEILSTGLGRAVLLLNASIYGMRAASELIFGDIRNGQSQFFFILTLLVGLYFLYPVFNRRVSKG